MYIIIIVYEVLAVNINSAGSKQSPATYAVQKPSW